MRGSTYSPCWVSVEEADDKGNTKITAYGMQPHLMTPVSSASK